MLGNRIRAFRLERGLNLGQLAAASGLSASYLSTIERGLKKPSIPVLKNIADALHVSSALLVLDEDETFTGEKLRFLREGRGLSLEELAEISELPAALVEKFEAGESRPDFEQLEQLAEALNFTVSYFLEKGNYQTGIGVRLKQLREGQGLTAALLADKAGVSSGLISQIENSYTIPSLDTLERLADSLGTTVHYFLLQYEEIENLLSSLGPNLIELLGDHKVQAILRSIRDLNAAELRYVLNYLQFFKRNRKYCQEK
ncbi:MAG: helix-turn-helix domain-containing protein [Peptococcaceae bacterium]|nr:helix-turn-helix domain-containing protein [Peptococcaceae bacterium]MBS3947260.1 helix-turn-helix domain-containing protein [Dethiobacter sp.]